MSPEDILHAKREHFEGEFMKMGQIPLRPGFLPFLQWILDQGIVAAIGTVTPRESAKELLDRTGITTYLVKLRLVAREDVEHPKPAPDVYIRTAELCGVPGSQQLVFEDSPAGVRAAKLAGSRVVAIPAVHAAVIAKRLASEGAEAIFPSWENPKLRNLVAQMIMAQN